MNKPTNVLTRKGAQEKQEELTRLKAYLSGEMAEKIKEARSHGDLSENAEYDAAMDEQGEVATRIKELEAILANAEIIDDDAISTEKVGIGIIVKFLDVGMNKEMEFKIVGTKEADFKENKMSDESPIGAALMGHAVGETVEAETPSGTLKFKILEIKKDDRKAE